MQAAHTSVYTCIYARRSHEQFRQARSSSSRRDPIKTYGLQPHTCNLIIGVFSNFTDPPRTRRRNYVAFALRAASAREFYSNSNQTQQRSPWKQKSACMQANKEEVCVHVRAGQLQIAAALACAHAHMASSTLRPRPKWLRRAPTTSTTDHVDHHLSGSAELRPPDHVAMMIAAKNGATTTVTIVVTTSQKARGSDNFITIDQISIQR